jgi:hypothetical protein
MTCRVFSEGQACCCIAISLAVLVGDLADTPVARAAGTESGSLRECERRHARSDDVRYRGANFLEYLFQI